jgi:hypothetical protein
VGIKLTVYFEDPFWVGLFEREDGDGYAVSRVVFGSEPSSPEVHRFVLSRCPRLAFVGVGNARVRNQALRSPKRAQRLAAAMMKRTAICTRAQEAMRVAPETRKAASREGRRAQAEIDRTRRRRLRIAKRKRRHRGH